MPWNIPILLTWLRIAAIPLIVGIYFLPDTWISDYHKDLWATILFLAAAITDWFDGYLARKLKQTSAFGAFLDPVADKLMVSAALLVLLQLQRIDAFSALIIIGREIAISALREWMAEMGARKNIAVHWIGKVKTAVQMAAIPLLLYHTPLFDLPTQHLGQICLYVAVLLTVFSMIYYLRKAWPLIKQQR